MITGEQAKAKSNAPSYTKVFGTELIKHAKDADRGADYTAAYNQVIGVLAAGAACFAVATWWCFRDNPKSGGVNA